MNTPHVHKNSGTGWDNMPIVLVVSQNPVWDTHGRSRMPSQQFLHDRVDVGKGRPVREVRQSFATHDCVEFLLHLLLYFGVEGHSEEERSHHGIRLKEAMSVVNSSMYIARDSPCPPHLDD